MVRQKDKKVKDLTVQMEEERKQSQQYKDQVRPTGVEGPVETYWFTRTREDWFSSTY